MNEMTQLVVKAKNGDKNAYGKIYEQIYAKLYRVALYTLGNKEDAEDAVSETFVEGYKGIKKLKDENAFNSWIHAILNVRCKRRIKRYVADREYKIGDDISELDYGLGIDSADNDVARLDLISALSRISPEERQLVVLATIEGYKMKEIAQIVKMPMGTVTSKIHRALKKLRNDLEGSETY